MAETTSTSEESAAGISFSPPLYIQRYNLVTEFVASVNGKKVVDMGCSECGLLRRLKMTGCIECAIGVDVDGDTLMSNKWKLKPLLSDYLHGNRRIRPLTFHLLRGSVCEADSRLLDVDVFCLIEVIEHLTPDVLDKVPNSVFGVLKPQYVVVTTPNADFNVLFPNFSGMRHWDHKFEWSRRDFCLWCEGVCRDYGYSVQYRGLGDPTPGHEHVGFCTQVAIFTCEAGRVEQCRFTVFEEIGSWEFPFSPQEDLKTLLLREVVYHVNCLSRVLYRQGAELTLDSGLEYIAVPIEDLLKFSKLKKFCPTSSPESQAEYLIRTVEDEGSLLMNSSKTCFLVLDIDETAEDSFPDMEEFDSLPPVETWGSSTSKSDGFSVGVTDKCGSESPSQQGLPINELCSVVETEWWDD